MAPEVLSARALNRATLARQLLLERSDLGAVEAVQQLVSLQAQFARPVHAGLWTRLLRLPTGHVTALAADRQLVRATMMRHTLHVLSAGDYLAFRRVVQPGSHGPLRRWRASASPGWTATASWTPPMSASRRARRRSRRSAT